MKLLLILTVVSLASGQGLLDMSQVLWSKVLEGGYRRIGRVDPLFVPVIKVDQSEGNTTYRIILRNLTVTGLNASSIESVQVVRGKLKSNLSDNEAGYVSYNQLRGLDSVRYRFHTLVKEPKSLNGEQEQKATEQFERIVRFDPMATKADQQQDFMRPVEIGGQRFRAGFQPGQDRIFTFGDTRFIVNSTPKPQAEIRVSYVNGGPQVSTIRPCIGACRPSYLFQQQQQQQPVDVEYARRRQFFPDQSFNNPTANPQDPNNPGFPTTPQVNQNSFPDDGSDFSGPQFSGNFGNTRFQFDNPNGQRPNQFDFQGGNNGFGFQGNFGNNQFSVNRPNPQNPGDQFSNQFSMTGTTPNPGQQFPNQFSISGVTPAPIDETPVENPTPTGPGVQFTGTLPPQSANPFGRPESANPFGRPESANPFARPDVGTPFRGQDNGNTFRGQANGNPFRGQPSGNPFRGPVDSDTSTGNFDTMPQFGGANQPDFRGQGFPNGFFSGNGPANPTSFNTMRPNVQSDGFTGQTVSLTDNELRYLCQARQEPALQNFEFNTRRRTGERPTTPAPADPTKTPPLVRIEKQPGYIDIIYSPDNKNSSVIRRFENIQAAPGTNSSKPIGFMEIIKNPNGNQSYIIRNFTEGETLKKRIDAIQAAADSGRLEDLMRYARDFQENQGYFEEGMELIYHFGSVNASGGLDNETLTRKKRQQMNDTEEDDVMHVVVKMRVPRLGVNATYALLGQVDTQPLRGAGLLEGSFTDVTADFTVELKKVDNSTMVVRAARAKLVSAGRDIKLQGMDERGPVKRILSHGLMAAEAVAAMVADDLASKALNEGNNEAMIFKMYKNLPAVNKA